MPIQEKTPPVSSPLEKGRTEPVRRRRRGVQTALFILSPCQGEGLRVRLYLIYKHIHHNIN